MSFHVETGPRLLAGQPHTVFTLTDATGANRAEVWPSFGCNCLRWRVAGPGGPLELLYVAPDWDSNPVPTRSGIPVLFPFPNRIRDGRYTWAGRDYQLPINGPGGKHAIHGFACRHPWRVVDSGGSADKAWLTAEFQGSLDAPETLALWPADYRLSLTVELRLDRLSFVARMDNPDSKPLPFGLGYHPYFVAGEQSRISVAAPRIWELAGNLPTGRIIPAPVDLTIAKPYSDLHLDDVYTGFERRAETECRGRVEHSGGTAVEVWTTPGFRELVAFTPPHRQAVCLEPYTCTTDAINLEARGIDAGWQVLAPGYAVSYTVTYCFDSRQLAA